MRTRFGAFVLDSDTRLLEREGEPVHLTGKAFELLEVLLANRPRVVSREELLDRVWPDVVVAAENVKNLVAEIRRALGDGGEWIRTVHHVGYAFAGDAREEKKAPPDALAWLYYRGEAVPLTNSPAFVGRDQECDVCLDSPGVSRRHARIIVDGDAAILEDLGSKNGTRVGHMRVSEPVVLHDGDRIRVGPVRLTYRTGSQGGRTLTDREEGD